jgi:death-on-curing protein
MTKRYLTKEQIIRIHEELIDRHGGLRGIMDERLIESSLGRLQSGYYADPIEEAAALMESLGSNHPFFDGNKRVAVTSSFTNP